jgi:hypothetical protein
MTDTTVTEDPDHGIIIVVNKGGTVTFTGGSGSGGGGGDGGDGGGGDGGGDGGGGDGGGEPPPDGGEAPDGPQDELTVGPGCYFAEPADALGMLNPGGTMWLLDAVYLKCFANDKKDATFKSVSGNPYACYFDGQGGVGGGHRLAWGKGIVICTVNTNFDGIGFVRAGSPPSGDNYSNEAGVWAGDSDGSFEIIVNVHRCAFDNCANGCFTGAQQWNITVNITESIYGYLKPNGQNATIGYGGGHPAHDNYLQCGEANVSGSYFYGCQGGHNIKSRCKKTKARNNPCMVQDGGRVLDISDGGEVEFTGNTTFTRKDRTNNPPPGTFGNANHIMYCGESASLGNNAFTMGSNVLNISRLNSVVCANMGSRIAASGDTVNYFEDGGLQVQGNVAGLSGGSAPPGAPAAPALPAPPSWAKKPADAAVRVLQWEVDDLRRLLATLLPEVQLD